MKGIKLAIYVVERTVNMEGPFFVLWRFVCIMHKLRGYLWLLFERK